MNGNLDSTKTTRRGLLKISLLKLTYLNISRALRNIGSNHHGDEETVVVARNILAFKN